MELLTFSTLLLGLVIGTNNIELLVADEVASVEIHVDGRQVETLTGPPWSFLYNFGTELHPHEIVAVAHDHDGQEISRIRSWVNLPGSLVGSSLFLEGSAADGHHRAARLTWQNAYGTEPESITATLDGVPIRLLPDAHRFVLPAHDPMMPHYLRTELDFGRYGTAVSEVAFGGGFGAQVRTELTAVPVVMKRGRSLKPDKMAGWFLHEGDPITVRRVDKEAADLVVVIDTEARRLLTEMLRDAFIPTSVMARVKDEYMAIDAHSGPALRLWEHEQLSIVWHVPTVKRQHNRAYEIFDHAGPYTIRNKDLTVELVCARPTDAAAAPQQLADAVAAAGTVAAARGHRRTVVLITAGNEPDASHLSPAVAMGYLEDLRVPLVVWSPRRKAPPTGPWGEVREVSSLRTLAVAFDSLRQQMRKQRIVWLDGAYLPQKITLSPEVTKIELAR